MELKPDEYKNKWRFLKTYPFLLHLLSFANTAFDPCPREKIKFNTFSTPFIDWNPWMKLLIPTELLSMQIC
jgi:hypothetical protein